MRSRILQRPRARRPLRGDDGLALSVEWQTSLDDAREGAMIKEVVVSPGEALFLPVGWWHEVRSLDVSVSLSFTNLRRANRFDWYRPGAP